MANEYYVEKLIKISPSKGLNNISYAQNILINMIKERSLRSFCNENNIPHSDVYRMATGERQPGYYIIAALCQKIYPNWWFTSIDEKKPKKLIKIVKPAEKTELKNTLGFKKLQNLTKDEITSLTVNSQAVYKLKTGQTGILTFRRIIEFSPKINPVDWFIFEE